MDVGLEQVPGDTPAVDAPVSEEPLADEPVPAEEPVVSENVS
jgi:hypothetical protein